jgi:hypothetical protein
MSEFPSLCIDTNLTVRCRNENEAISIYKSLIADNTDIPSCLIIDIKADQENFTLITKFTQNEIGENNINTLINTIDEIMEHISLVRNVIRND